jgi:reductive dehalogenase
LTDPHPDLRPLRHDERDTMFARMAREPGSPQYENYYARCPELQEGDDRLRSMVPLLAPGSRFHDGDLARETEEYFAAIETFEVEEALVGSWKQRLEASEDQKSVIASLLRSLGAVAVGCTAIEPEYVYTHKGRLQDDYGQQVLLDHQTAIVFLVEMDFDDMRRAPRMEVIRESARQYYIAARASMVLAAVLRASGFDAKSHHDAHYDLILPPLAVKAGLGEVGRNNILIAERFGSRVRIGAVTCDLELEHDQPVSLGADAFCEICKKCADNCPSRSLSTTSKEDVAGVMKWPTRVETCYAYWRSVGTDCGICMVCCPFSHRNNWFHNLVRWMIRRWPAVHRPALWFDDLIYGREWKAR